MELSKKAIEKFILFGKMHRKTDRQFPFSQGNQFAGFFFSESAAEFNGTKAFRTQALDQLFSGLKIAHCVE